MRGATKLKIYGYLISGYADGGDAPDRQLRLVPGAAEEAEVFLAPTPRLPSC